jgi:hypothetical protein
VVPAGGCRAVALATLTTDSAGTDLAFPGSLLADGLPDASGDTCGTAADPRARTPALAASSSRVVASWVAGSFIDSCGVAASAAPVLVNGATFNAGTRALAPGAAAALSLGSTYDASGPAAAALSADRFVVAHADGSDLVVSRVAVDASGVVTLLEAVRHEVGGGLDVGDVALTSLDATRLVLAFRVGCGTQARVMTAVQGLASGTGVLASTLGARQALDAGSVAQRRPQLAVRDLPVGVTVVWEADNALRMRQLDAAGLPLGTAQTAYISAGTLSAGHYVYPLPDSPAFGVLVAEALGGGSGALQSFQLRCAP